MWERNGYPLCVEHDAMVQRSFSAAQADRAALINFFLDQADAIVGIPTGMPRMEVPTPVVATGNTFHNHSVNVAGDNLGVINNGQIERVHNAVTQMRHDGQGATAQAIGQLTVAVVRANDLADETKKTVMESLVFLSEQAALARQGRQPQIGKLLVEHLERMLHGAASVATVWQTAGPALIALLS